MAKYYLAVIAALVTLIGCSKEPSGEIEPEGACTVRFRGAGRSEAIPVASKAIVPVPQGVTVGVLAYQRDGGGAADITADVFREWKTYVTGAGGILTPGQADDAGNPVAGDAAAMELSNGTYDFYAYSPALKLESDHYTIKGIGHYTDFMGAAVPARAVSRSAADVDLLFEHKCSKIRFNVKTIDGMDNSSLEAEKVMLNKMAVSPAADFTVGGDIVPTLGADADACTLEQVEPAADNKSTSVWGILLPKNSGAFGGKFFLTIEGKRYMLQARDIPAMSFLKSTQYIFTALVREGSVSLVLNVASWDAVSGSVDAGEGDGAGTDPWGGGSGETGGQAGTNHGIEVGRWDNVDWSGGMGGNPDAVTGAVEVGSWTPAQVLVDAGGGLVADVDTWVRNELAAQAGANHGGGVDGWEVAGFGTDMGGGIQPANCYMVKPGKSVTFDPRIQGNGGAGAVKMAPAYVQVLWQEGLGGSANVIESADLNSESGLATVKAHTYGNAVVAAYNVKQEILWSWHIWVTDYAPDGSGNYYLGPDSKMDVPGGQVHSYGPKFRAANPGKVIMDRDLGARQTLYVPPMTDWAIIDNTYGLQYQWGRKDPFPPAMCGSPYQVPDDDKGQTITIYGPDGTTELTEGGTGLKNVKITDAGVVSGGTTLAYSIKNPLTFIYVGPSGTMFCPDNWWGGESSSSAKSIYDPCPAGWRVPPKGTWDDFSMWNVISGGTTTYLTLKYYEDGQERYPLEENPVRRFANNGALYKDFAWYPAAGYRHPYDGSLNGWASNGYYWSRTPDADQISGYGFDFTPENVTPAGGGRNYADGRPVRCIQE